MKKLAKEIKRGDKIKVANQAYSVEETEIADIGKQGKRKIRIVALTERKEKIVLIRPEDYPFETG